MINADTLHDIEQAPISERLQVIQQITHSIERDVQKMEKEQPKKKKPFKVRKFNLGQEVHVDREEMYADRGLWTVLLIRIF